MAIACRTTSKSLPQVLKMFESLLYVAVGVGGACTARLAPVPGRAYAVPPFPLSEVCTMRATLNVSIARGRRERIMVACCLTSEPLLVRLTSASLAPEPECRGPSLIFPLLSSVTGQL